MARPKTLTPHEELHIVTRYQRGEPAQAIAKATGILRMTVVRTLQRYGITTRPELAKNRIPDDQKEQVIEMCLGGHTAVDIAEKFGVSTKTVYRLVKTYGLSLPSGPRKRII